ncbi:MAG TPA: GldG family protein [Polyangia bacterium]|nr:GldG family protein [Polyangia bacterium]
MSKAKTGVNALVFVTAVLLGLVAINIVGNRYFKRVDFTQDRIYTLSPASKELVAKLPDRLTVKAFISGDLQPPFSQVAQYVRDLLDEYAAASKGKFKWEAVDPNNKDLEQEAEKLKVPKMRRGRVSSNKVEIGSSYLGVAFQYQGQIESIPEINSQEGLEFQMTSIIKMLTVKKRKVAFANSEGELGINGDPQHSGAGGLSNIHRYMGDFEVTSVALNQGAKPIPDDVDALVVAGPKAQMSERAQYVIDQFLMRGKSVAFFVDGMTIEAPRQMQIPGMDQPKIGRHNEGVPDQLLEAYGLKVRDDIVLEPMQNVPGPVPVGGQLQLANYPAFIAATKLAEKDPIMAGVRVAILPFASSLELVKDKQPGLSWTPLATSTPNAWRQSGFFLFDPQAQLKVGEDKGPFVLAYAATGKLKSAFAGKPYPNEKGEKVNPPEPNVSLAPGVEKPLDESTGPVRIVVFGDADFASDEYMAMARYVQLYLSNLQLAVNVMDWITQDDTLAQVRAKGVQSRPLSVGRESTPDLVKYANIVGVPFAFVIFGMLRWRVRSSRRRNARL